ncbi:FtsQ-type POTRA domain-containing protein [Patescibacteria group bacterium]|nr:FtsQ-type POTRA domain-containing protein [Patescibacteria group bacterium]
MKCVKKDYQQKSLSNPFFHSRQKKNPKYKSKRNFFLFVITFFLLLSGLFYFLFISSSFSLQNIQVNGLTRSGDENILVLAWTQSEESKLFFLKQSNLFLFEDKELQADINKNFSFADVKIKKQWPHTLVVSVEERALAFIWRDGTGDHFSDREGCLIPEVQPSIEDEQLYPVLGLSVKENYIQGDNCLKIDVNYLSSMLSLNDQLKFYDNLTAQEYILEAEFNTLTLDLLDGPDVYFNIKNDLEKQVKKLAVIKREKPELEFQALSYIDLRYGDRVYFK